MHIRSRRKGFTLVEITVTLVVLAAMSTFAYVTFQHVTARSQQQGATSVLSSVQVKARGLAAQNSYTYPANTTSSLSTNSVSVGTTASTSSSVVSAYLVDTTTLVLTVSSGGACEVLVDHTNALPTWGVSSSPSSCSANLAAGVRSSITSTSPTSPTSVTF